MKILRHFVKRSTAIIAVAGCLAMSHAAVAAGLSVARLRCEYLDDPIGIDARIPRLSWVVESHQRGQKQSAYEVLVASSRALLDRGTGDLWNSGRTVSDETVQIPYQGKPLAARMACWWKVRVLDQDGRPSAWSKPARWTMGLLEAADWDARWIGQPTNTFPASGDAPAPYFRKAFTLDRKPVRATLYAAAMGYQELHVNGQRIGDEVCGPPVSDYNQRAYYSTYDVSSAVKQGPNAVGLWLGRGWYCADFPGVIHPGPIARVQLEVTLDDGTIIRVSSDKTWKTHPGPVTALANKHGNLKGERYDATAEVPDWDQARCDETSWIPATTVEPPTKVLCAAMMEPNRVTETIVPVTLKELSPGDYLFDLGRNLTGQFELRLKGTPGTPVKLSFIERWDEKAKKWIDYGQGDIYLPRTTSMETFRNQFNYHAFRYVRVSGLAHPPSLKDARALFVQTDYTRCGSFECSNPLLNRIYDMTLYTFRCVSAGGDTVDCPHRERLGYGGDGQITSKSALYAFNLGPLYTKWLGNWRDVQDPQTGALPNIAPNPHPAGGGPTWGAICVLLPWDLYQHYGDRRALAENYAMMKKYVVFLDSKAENNLLKPYGHKDYGFLGDWVAPDHDQGTGPWSPEEDRTFFNNCFYAYIADHLALVATALGEGSDVALYKEKAGTIRKATHARYFKPDQNSYAGGVQADLAFALLSGVTPDELRPAVMKNLEHTIVETKRGHLDTGMHGTMFLLRCLNELGRDDLAFLVMNQKTYPGWGYMIDQGATTMWERWDGKFSQIHSTLLAAGEWFPRALCGIKPDASQPGFKRVIIDPRPVGDVKWAKARYDTIRGAVVSEWKIKDNRFLLDVEVPANTTALIRLPTQNPAAITESGRTASSRPGIAPQTTEPGLAAFEVGPGIYHFASDTGK